MHVLEKKFLFRTDKQILFYCLMYQNKIENLCSIEQDLAVAIDAKCDNVKDHMRDMYPILVDEV